MWVLVAAPLLGIAISVFALGGIASAHVVTSITADCYGVTVHFSDFPVSGVMVHIAADVNGQTTISSDVLVTNTTSQAHLDISAATTTLFGTAAHIDVDVTWTYLGPQHVHDTLTATCGTSTTTNQASTTTTTVPAPTTTQAPATTAVATTTSAVPVTTTTSASTTTTSPQTTTSIQVHAATTILTTPTARATTTLPAAVTLPRTGSNTAFPLMCGLSCLIAGTLLLGHQHRAGRRNEPSGEATS